MKRLECICETFLDKSKTTTIPESTWWDNMKWTFENLRKKEYNMCDLTLVCKDGKNVVEVPCHAVILTAACKYFYGMLLGNIENEEKKTMRIEIEDITEKQMESILKFIYTREFDVGMEDVVGVWVKSNKFLLDDLQIECESMITKNINKDNVEVIKEIAEMVQSKRIIEVCEETLIKLKKESINE
jgi:hypothetical protein